MRRTNSRSSRSHANGARRASSSRSRSTRSKKRPSRPHLTQRQVREIAGVLLILAGLLGVLAVASHAGSILTGLQQWLVGSFGRAWFVPVAAAVALGAYLLWPQARRPRALDVLAGAVAVIALIGLFGLAAHAGGAAGRAIDGLVVGMAGEWGAWALLVAGLVIGLIVTIHFSPGSLIAAVVNAMRATYNERRRLDRLVASPTEQGKPAAKAAGVVATEDVGPAYPPIAPPLRSWEVETEHEARPLEARVSADVESETDDDKPVLRVIAEPEDEPPEIEWKLPSIALLDTVTARRERMADEIKRNVRIIESTLETFGVSCKVVGVNPGPAVTQYELQPGAGVQVKRITALQNDLSLALAAAPLRIEAPIPGKSAVGIEVPNKSASLVTIREVLETA
ncbi:MAG TPA: DNA translocase FtsK, partial [Candidatus Dormibacteraeota bacterium]